MLRITTLLLLIKSVNTAIIFSGGDVLDYVKTLQYFMTERQQGGYLSQVLIEHQFYTIQCLDKRLMLKKVPL